MHRLVGRQSVNIRMAANGTPEGLPNSRGPLAWMRTTRPHTAAPLGKQSCGTAREPVAEAQHASPGA